MRSGFVVIGDSQYFNGYALLLNKRHVESMLELSWLEKFRFLRDLLRVYRAVFSAFKPIRLNVELLGNTDHHLHWHIFPRYHTDTHPKKVVWVIDGVLRNKKASHSLVQKNKNKLKREL